MSEGMAFLLFFGATYGAITVFCIVHGYVKDYRQKATKEAAEKEENRKIIEASKAKIKNFPRIIEGVERSLNAAEAAFKEGAYAPFWDAIERAILHLELFNNDVSKVVSDSKSYKYVDFSSRLPDPRKTMVRLESIVHKAQRDFQFSMIYEQRKTNRILIAGFGSLADALNGMSYRIEESIDSLSDTISVSFNTRNLP